MVKISHVQIIIKSEPVFLQASVLALMNLYNNTLKLIIKNTPFLRSHCLLVVKPSLSSFGFYFFSLSFYIPSLVLK